MSRIVKELKQIVANTKPIIIVKPNAGNYLTTKLIGNNATVRPPQGQQWEILSITIAHATGTLTTLAIYKGNTTADPKIFIEQQLAATANVNYLVDLKSSKYFLDYNYIFMLTGDAATTATIYYKSTDL